MLSVLAVALAATLDAALGEPPTRYHPVAWFGTLVGWFDLDWRRPRLVGLALAVALPLFAAGVVGGVVWTAGRVHPLVEVVAAGLALYFATSLRMLVDVALDVVARTVSNLDGARRELRALAGRDADALSAPEVRSAAVESAAENLADGLVAPLVAFAVLAPVSPALGAAGAAWVKAVNTLDSMLGYRSKPVGEVPARLDDAVMWLPARASAALLALAAGDVDALGRARPFAGAPSSPNSGWPMATLAVLLGVRLEKPGAYTLGSGDLPSLDVSRRGVRLVGRAGALGWAVAVLALAAGVVAWS